MEEKEVNMAEERVFTQKEVEGIITQVNMQARQQCEGLARRCQYLEEQLAYKRLDYLFKVIENRNSGVFSMEFIHKCASEIESALIIPETPDEQEPEKED